MLQKVVIWFFLLFIGMVPSLRAQGLFPFSKTKTSLFDLSTVERSEIEGLWKLALKRPRLVVEKSALLQVFSKTQAYQIAQYVFRKNSDETVKEESWTPQKNLSVFEELHNQAIIYTKRKKGFSLLTSIDKPKNKYFVYWKEDTIKQEDNLPVKAIEYIELYLNQKEQITVAQYNKMELTPMEINLLKRRFK